MSPMAYVLMTLLSLALSYGIYKKGDIETKTINSRISQNKVSYADVISLLNKIKGKAEGLSLGKRNSLVNQLNQVGNSSFASSGLSEQLLGDLRSRLNNITDQIDKLRGMGDVESKMSDNLVAAYSALSDEEKSKSKKKQPTKTDVTIDPISKKTSITLATKGDVNSWDPETIGGRTMIEAEQHAENAAKYYNQANALGEKYAK